MSERFWSLDALTPAEWQLVCELPEVASGRDFRKSSRDRLYPSPLSKDTLADEDTLSQLEDWDEFVRPELADTFSKARELVKRDIATGKTFPADEILEGVALDWLGESQELYRLEVPLDHTEGWYSVLNQARLLMNEEYNLAESEERMIALEHGIESIDQERIMLLAQYELYSVLQSILVESVMDA